MDGHIFVYSLLPVRSSEATEHCGMQACHGQRAFDVTWTGDYVSLIHCISLRGMDIEKFLGFSSPPLAKPKLPQSSVLALDRGQRGTQVEEP